MSDYALVRTRSAVSLCGPPSTMTLTRTYSVPDLTSYVRASDKWVAPNLEIGRIGGRAEFDRRRISFTSPFQIDAYKLLIST
jgi:hypothetical protein